MLIKRTKIVKQKAYPEITEAFIVNLLQTPPDSEHKIIYKGRNIVWEVKNKDGERFIVKEFKRLNFLQAIPYLLKGSKAKRSYENSVMLLQAGLTVPYPIAYIEISVLGVVVKSLYICECDYSPDIVNLIRRKDFNKDVVKALSIFLVKMHSKKITHGDLNCTNILKHSHSFSLIDTNRALQHSRITRRDIIKDLSRVTHRRDVLKSLGEFYWENACDVGMQSLLGKQDRFIQDILHEVVKFEHRKNVLHRLRDCLK